MKRVSHFFLIAVLALALAVLLCACGSTAPSRFYTLSPVAVNAPMDRDPLPQGGLTVGVGPVGIPDYLERPHIVTRSGENGLELAEYDRWAGSLKQDIMRVLIQDLTALLPPGASVVSWKRGIPVDYRVAVEVTSLDVVPGQSVLLRGQWAIFGSEPKTPLTLRTRTFSEPLVGRDMNVTVMGIGNAVGQLSQAIAADIRAQAADRATTAPPADAKGE